MDQRILEPGAHCPWLFFVARKHEEDRNKGYLPPMGGGLGRPAGPALNARLPAGACNRW